MTTAAAAEQPVLRAFLGDPALKAKLLKEIRLHEQQDQIVKGTYGEQNGQWRGCAIGCALHSLNRLQGLDKVAAAERTGEHTRFPAELGVPIELAYLIDHVFEHLPLGPHTKWPRQVITAIAPGADLSGIVPSLIRWTILDPTYGWAAYAKTTAQKAVLDRAAALVAQDWAGTTVPTTTWDALDAELTEALPEWAWAGAWAWARAGADWYSALAKETLRLLKATKAL